MSDLWEAIEKHGLKRIATKDAGWLFCVKNSNLTNEAIRLVRSQKERNNLSYIETETTDSGIPYITWGKLPYNGFMKAKGEDRYFNVKRESWWNGKSLECYVQSEDGSFQVFNDDEIQGNH